MKSSLLPPVDLEYPETDNLPLAENTTQFRWIVLVKENLEVVFERQDDVFIAGDLFWYPVEGRPDIRTAPDVMLAFGRPKGERRSYLQWKEGDIAPQVVWEILSPGNRAAAMEEKVQWYEYYGVEEYYIYDPDTGETLGWIRRNDRLEPIPNMNGWVSPRMQVRFEIVANELRLLAPDGKAFQLFKEVVHQARHAQQQAEQAQLQLQEQARIIEELRQKLRDQGIQPDV